MIFQLIMGNLPKQQVKPSHPFSVCDVDFACPLIINLRLKINAALSKGFVCIFVYFLIKAVHAHLVGLLDIEQQLHLSVPLDNSMIEEENFPTSIQIVLTI